MIRENLRSLGLEARAQVRQARVLATIEKIEADILFLDPPYEMEKEYALALELLGSRSPVLVIVQHDVRLKLEESYGALQRTRELKQSDNVLSFYE